MSLWLPIIILLGACIPGVPAQLALYGENKALDLFFVFMPKMSHVAAPVIAARDQRLIDAAGGEPGRSATARALERLASAGARAIGIDFVYDQAKNEIDDTALAKAFRACPGTIVAERFQQRTQKIGIGGIATVDSTDEHAIRPPPPISLYEQLVGEAADRGLINCMPDNDATVRSMPLAFHPDGVDEFRPSLGFATWLFGLVSNIPTHDWESLSEPDFSSGDDPGFPASVATWLESAFAAAPRPFIGLNHSGLNQIIRRREVIATALRACREKSPAIRRKWLECAQTTDLTRIPLRTRLDLPLREIPWFGDFDRPMLRLPFMRTSGLSKGDGIPVVSLGALAFGETRAGNDLIEIQPDIDQMFSRLVFSFADPGSGTLSGKASNFDGMPASGTEVWCRHLDGPYWASTTADVGGIYHLEHLHIGTYTVEIRKYHKDSLQRLVLLSNVFVGTEPIQLPPARFLPMDLSVGGPLLPSSEPRRLVVEADGVWVGRTASAGALPLPCYQPGFDTTVLNEDTKIEVASSFPFRVTASGVPVINKRVALTETVHAWDSKFRAVASVDPGKGSYLISGLGPALGARMRATRSYGTTSDTRPVEFDLVENDICELPAPPPGNSRTTWRKCLQL
ncbi:MAG: CHASE2 domain-containing protein [Candidatus Riflebacteria bacterium]|nr:CHASE2 domain-containing protein [Candidatus Riflebacteria bacterium]